MTHILKYPFIAGFCKKTICFFALLCMHYICFAQPNLENNIPINYKAAKGTLSISDRHYRLGEQSLRWDWVEGDTLIILLTQAEQNEVNENLRLWEKNHFEMWVYNEMAGKDTFEVKFINQHDEDQFVFTYNVNYSGWRKLLRSYRLDMPKKYPVFSSDKWNVKKIFIIAPVTSNGCLYIDNMQYMRNSEMKHSDRQMPDLYSAANYKEKLISDLYYKIDSLNNIIPVTSPSVSELTGLQTIKNRINDWFFGSAPTQGELNDANSEYNTYNILMQDGFIKGKDIESPQQIMAMFVTFTYSYLLDNNINSRDRAINLIRLMLDCGIAGGSSRWFAGGNFGYRHLDFFKALIDARSFMPSDLIFPIYDFLKWSTGINLGWMENPNGLFDSDNLYVLCRAYFCTILYNTDDASAVKDLKCLKNYIEKFLEVQKGNTDGMKPDGTMFHHFAHYNGYTNAQSALIDPILTTLIGTSYQINESAYANLIKVIYSQYICSNEIEYANSLSGRNPFNTTIFFNKEKFPFLSLVGGDILGKNFDPLTAGMSVRLYGTSPRLPNATAEPFPSGFWQMNYSPLAIYRKENWATTIKGINNYFWGTEIYPGANRYGRYQSYGAVEIMYPGGPTASGVNATGWDWNKTPGATTILLPFNSLVLPSTQSKLDERNEYNFSGGVKFGTPAPNAPSDVILADLHGDYGMFGLNFKQLAATATHNPSFKFRKSFFCFGDKIVCLGSNINNNDATHQTITTLFQGALPSTATPTIVDGATKTGISQSEDLAKTDAHWLIDAYKTGYYTLPGNTIHVERQSQTSPDQSGSGATTTANYANAYINHGKAPSGNKYAYVIAPNTTSQKMAAFANDMQSQSTRAFDILQQDTAAHIIRENKNNVTGFSLFLPNDNLTTNDILKSNDVPCVAVMQIREDTLRISLVNPDLNLIDNQSTAVPITLTIYDSWSKIPEIHSKYANVLSSEESETIIQFNPADGMPAEIALVKRKQVVLPLTQLSLSGRTDMAANQNILNLTIENDNEATNYYLERQISGSATWNVISDYRFDPSTVTQEFNFFDTNIDAAAYLYRIKWQQSSGKWQYSNTVILKNENATRIIISPNPTRDAFTVHLKYKPKGTLSWFLSDVSGKAVRRGRLNNTIENIVVQELSPGLYFFHLSTGETMRIVIAR